MSIAKSACVPAVVLFLALVGCTGDGGEDGLGSSTTTSTALTTTTSSVAAGTWTALPPAPLSARSEPLVAWAGTEFIVAGGLVETAPGISETSVEAAAFNPASGKWRRLPDAPRPLPGDAAAAWTGTEFVVIGGALPETMAVPPAKLTGIAYSPGANRWRNIRPSSLRPRWATFSTWTGRELLVWVVSRSSRTCPSR